MKIKLLVTPLVKGAYFYESLDTAMAEFSAHFPAADITPERIGVLDFLNADIPETALDVLVRLSCVQGIFEDRGESGLVPLPIRTGFLLAEDMVFGAKYQGKTHELVTQLAINVGLASRTSGAPARRLLDPLAGRGTTLLWALRYGLNAVGIERDPGALPALHRHVKKQTKLHRIKHTASEGYVGKKTKTGIGQFVKYEMAGQTLQLIMGDSRHTPELLNKARFDLIVSDLPYGVRFKGDGQRDPLSIVRDCAEGWLASLQRGGAMALIFNRYQPKRQELSDAFVEKGARVLDFSAPHRMSESIVRDLLVVTPPDG